MATIDRPAPGIEVHHKHCPEGEGALQYAVCYSTYPGCWYVQRRASSMRGAAQVVRKLRKAYGGAVRPASAFRIWDTHGPWPTE